MVSLGVMTNILTLLFSFAGNNQVLVIGYLRPNKIAFPKYRTEYCVLLKQVIYLLTQSCELNIKKYDTNPRKIQAIHAAIGSMNNGKRPACLNEIDCSFGSCTCIAFFLL